MTAFETISTLTDKKAETFTFSEVERQDILQKAGNAGLLWNDIGKPTGTNLAKNLEQLRKRELSLNLHASTLMEYMKVQRIPRGLRSPLIPILLKDDTAYCERWQAICNQYSFDLMLLTIKHLHLAIDNVQQEVFKAEQELKKGTSPEEYNELHEALKINIKKMREQILQNKIRKYERDTKDYKFNRVYTWAENKMKNWRYNKSWKQENNQENLSTDSESQSSTERTMTLRSTSKQSKTPQVFLGHNNRQEETDTSSGEQTKKNTTKMKKKI